MSEVGTDKKDAQVADKTHVIPSAPMRGLYAWGSVILCLWGLITWLFMFFMRPFCTILWMAFWGAMVLFLVSSLVYTKETFAVMANLFSTVGDLYEYVTWSNLRLLWTILKTNASLAAAVIQ